MSAIAPPQRVLPIPQQLPRDQNRPADDQNGQRDKSEGQIESRFLRARERIGQIVDDDEGSKLGARKGKRRRQQRAAVDGKRRDGLTLFADGDVVADDADRKALCRDAHRSAAVADGDAREALVGGDLREEVLQSLFGVGRRRGEVGFDLVARRRVDDAGSKGDVAASPRLDKIGDQGRHD